MFSTLGRGLLAAAAFLATPVQTVAQTLTYTNAHPEIQMWSYPAGSANGIGSVRERAPTFASFSFSINGEPEPGLFPGSHRDPSRRGSFVVVADTTTSLPAGLEPSRYRIDSLKITTTLLGNLIDEDEGRVLPYDNSIDDAVSLTTGVDSDAGNPVEMYGIGFQGDYESISFVDPPFFDPLGGEQIEEAFQLGDVRWRQYEEGEEGYDPLLPPDQQALAPYQYFGVDANGNDVENSILSGGYSATDPTGLTTQFTPEPFAIGKVYDSTGLEMAPGVLLENGDEFVFEPDLTDLRVLGYIQRSLAEGHLGFSFSSMHQPAGHTGTVAYPDFYIDDLEVGYNPDGAAPVFELVVTVLLPGDANGDGAVDILDLDILSGAFGATTGATLYDGDFNGDGAVDILDLDILSGAFGAGSEASVSIPEPSGTFLVLIGTTVAFLGWMRWFVGPYLPPREDSDE